MSLLLIITSISASNISNISTNNSSEIESCDQSSKTCVTETLSQFKFNESLVTKMDELDLCESKVKCNELAADCLDCDFNNSCIYGEKTEIQCRPRKYVTCLGEQSFTLYFKCQYCYQSDPNFHTCTNNTSCFSNVAPRQRYKATCSVPSHFICLGKRKFSKMLNCNWSSGKRWSTALLLSITLGGFGADRFYLGLWREGIGKLFSFGGLGVWTLVDVVLIAFGYVGPADGSLYI